MRWFRCELRLVIGVDRFWLALGALALLAAPPAAARAADAPGPNNGRVSVDAMATLGLDGAITAQTRALFAGDGGAWVAGSPEIVTRDVPDLVALSPDGKAVLIAVTHRPPYHTPAIEPDDEPSTPAELDLIYWDGRARDARVVYREAADGSDSAPTVWQIIWLPTTRIALVTLARGEYSGPRTLLRVDTAAGTAHRLADLGPADDLEISPTQPIGTIESSQETPSNGPFPDRDFRVVTATGVGPSFTLPGGIALLSWSADGTHRFSTRSFERDAGGRIVHHAEITVVDLQTGDVTHPDQAPDPTSEVAIRGATPDAPLPFGAAIGSQRGAGSEGCGLRLRADSLIVGGGSSDAGELHIRSVWLEPIKSPSATAYPPTLGRPRLLLAAGDVHPAALMADGSAALFVRDGTLCAVPMFRLEQDAFAQALRRVQRTASVMNAKQIGLAMFQYMEDNDENFPANQLDIEATIQPYLEDPGVFQDPSTDGNGFTYTYAGPTLFATVGDPVNTELGYVTGPGGRAILFMDGHVHWEDDNDAVGGSQ